MTSEEIYLMWGIDYKAIWRQDNSVAILKLGATEKCRTNIDTFYHFLIRPLIFFFNSFHLFKLIAARDDLSAGWVGIRTCYGADPTKDFLPVVKENPLFNASS